MGALAGTPSRRGAPRRSPLSSDQWRTRLAAAPPERQAVEEGQPRSGSEERGPARRQAPRPDALAGVVATTAAAAPRPSLSGHRFAMPCRPMDELPQDAQSEAHGRSASASDRWRPDASPSTAGPPSSNSASAARQGHATHDPERGHPQPLHRTRHPHHPAHRLTANRERGDPAVRRSVQQRRRGAPQTSRPAMSLAFPTRIPRKLCATRPLAPELLAELPSRHRESTIS